jgi:hypothetical protein
VKRVRYMLGTHGPFEITVDRTADIGEIETAIQAKRAELAAARADLADEGKS